MMKQKGDLRFRRDQQISAGERGVAGVPDEKDEFKPNRVFQGADSLPTLCVFPVLLGLCFLSSLVYILDSRLPTPLTIRDVGNFPDSFVAEHAQAHLHRLVSFGSKPTGSYENEVLAVDYITKEISFIMQHSSPAQKILFDLQKPTGSFHVAMKPYGYTSYYAGVQNIVVRLSGAGSNSSGALLVNCHFDTVPTSPGGSDDGINCAVLLEVLRILSISSSPLAHDVIFLFNGAEENVLQASHGFITQHRWAKDVKAFINLEAAGAGGREVLFQASPKHPWLLQAYAQSVPHPHGLVFGEELFQSGIIPSDTDFRIFRDFGHIPGLDLAFARNGYVYHTKYDNEDQIPAGSFQHVGDNVLALVRKIANSPELVAPHDHSSQGFIYWDVLGLYFVRYSHTAGTIVNTLVAVWSVYTIVGTLLHLGSGVRHPELLRELWTSILGPVLGHFLSLGWAITLAVVLDWTRSTMSWYSHPLLIVPLYCLPAVLLVALGPLVQISFTKQSVLCTSVRVRLYCLATQLIWTICLLAFCLLGLRSGYILLLSVLCPTVVSTYMLWCVPQQYPLKSWVCLHLASLVFPIIVGLYHGLLGFLLFIPITGRMGSLKNPEILISILASLITFLVTNYLSPLILLLRRMSVVLWLLGMVHLLTVCIVIFTPLTFPYSVSEPNGVFPQRINLMHVHRELYGNAGHLRHSDSGFWMINMDRNAPQSILASVPELRTSVSAGLYCDSEIFCALPVVSPRILDLCQDSLWLPGPEPTIYQPISTEVTEQKVVAVNTHSNVRRLTFTLSGPDHMGVMFSPLDNIEVVSWSLAAELHPTHHHGGRPIYFIYYGRGLDGRPWNLSLDIQVPVSHNDYILDLTVAGHYMHDAKHYSPAFLDLLSHFPSWTHVTPWVSSLKSWKF